VEPVDYLKILKNHWKVVVALVVLGVAAAYFTSPKDPSRAYSATHLLVLEQSPEDTTSGVGNPVVAVEMVSGDEVAARVAEAIGWTGSTDDLVAKVEATPDPGATGAPLISIEAHDDDPDQAVMMANAFAEQLIDYVAEWETARTEAAVTEAATEATRLQQEITGLEQQRELVTDPEEGAGIDQQIETKRTQLAVAQLAQQRASVAARYATVRPAAEAETETSFIAGFSRAQRSLLAGLVAAVLGFGAAIMLDRSDSRLRTKEAAEQHFGLPVLAEVPLLALRERGKAAVAAFSREPRVAEAYRSLRTALLLFRSRSDDDHAATARNGNGSVARRRLPTDTRTGAVRQLVVVTSPEAGDGKSTTAANLAMAYAETGQSVLVVCWDLWRPMSPRVYGATDGPGVSDYLDGHGASLVRFVQDTSIPGVRIVTAGRAGHHPTTQIEAARALLDEARSLANVVIVDTAPLLSASVTRELVALGDAVVVVCRAGRTTSHAADRCSELLDRLGAPTLGVVLVGVPTGPFADYYGPPPSRGLRRLDRIGWRSRRGGEVDELEDEEVVPARHAVGGSSPPSGRGSLRPTAAQYRATIRQAPEPGRE
jgi:capsular exopolysaccharide synthesis family protein